MWIDLAPTIAVAVISFLSGGFIGYAIGARSSRDEAVRLVLVIVVMGVWSYRLISSVANPIIEVSIWEHIITGIIVGTFFKPSKEAIELLVNRVVPLRANAERDKV